jgi:hypothetical protein
VVILSATRSKVATPSVSHDTVITPDWSVSTRHCYAGLVGRSRTGTRKRATQWIVTDVASIVLAVETLERSGQ